MGTGKTSVSESLTTWEIDEDGIETEASQVLRDELGGGLLTGQAVSGIQAT